MNMNLLPVGTIFLSNNTRLIIVGYNQNGQDGYIVCPCTERNINTKTLYILLPNQIEKVLSLGYVDNVVESRIKTFDLFNNNIVPTSVTDINNQASGTGKYIFDKNGFVIGEQ